MTEAPDELDDLMPEPVDDFADLDADLNKAMEAVAEEEQHRADLKAQKRGFTGMSREEVEYCNSRMAVFNEARVWRPVENIAVFTTFECQSCHDSKRIFTRWMQKQQSRVTANTRQWLTMKKRNERLPTVVADELIKVDICTSCAPLIGLDTHNSKPLTEVLK